MFHNFFPCISLFTNIAGWLVLKSHCFAEKYSIFKLFFPLCTVLVAIVLFNLMWGSQVLSRTLAIMFVRNKKNKDWFFSLFKAWFTLGSSYAPFSYFMGFCNQLFKPALLSISDFISDFKVQRKKEKKN